MLKNRFEIKEINCKIALSKSGIYGIDYSINPYLGCEHNCAYCFARYMKKFSSLNKDWGEFVEVKKNITEILEKEIRALESGSILISSVTDPYQPTEERYKLTRKILEKFAEFSENKIRFPQIFGKSSRKYFEKFKITILTKSSLVTRDIDIIKRITELGEDIEVGFSICMLNEDVKKIIEPKSSSIEERINSLKEIKRNGIKTFAMIAPILPIITENDLENLLKEMKNSNVDYVLIDKLNIKACNWKPLRNSLEIIDKTLVDKYEKIIFSREYERYFQKIKQMILDLCSKLKLEFYFCY